LEKFLVLYDLYREKSLGTPDYQAFKIRQIMYIDQTMGSITGISTSTNLGKFSPVSKPHTHITYML
jgi:hypothetical protein